MYKAPGQGQITPGDKILMSTEMPYHFAHLFVASLKKKSLWSLIFYHFLGGGFHLYIAPGRGRQPIGDINFMTTESFFLFAHMLQGPKWSLRNLILYTFLMILYMYTARGKGQKTPQWQQKAIITSTICCKFQPNLFEF